MTRTHRSLIILALLIVAAVIVALGDVDRAVGLRPVLEVWADVLRDADQVGLQLTRVPDEEEMEFGRKVGAELLGRAPRNAEWERYVSAVGRALTPHVRRKGMQYDFHVLDVGVINAFAAPGGQVFVTRGLLEFVGSEAELSAVLGHEISHVDLRHCIERFQYEIALEKLGMAPVGQLAELMRGILTVGYQQYQEFEADAQGIRLCIEAGYDPNDGIAFFERMQRRFGNRTAQPKANTPVGEAAVVLGEAMGSYFDSHPPSAERVSRIRELVARNRARLDGLVLYRGVENLRQRIPRRQKELDNDRAAKPPAPTPGPAPPPKPEAKSDAPPPPAPAPAEPKHEPPAKPEVLEIALKCVEDAYVRKSSPKGNLGAEAVLRVDGGWLGMGDDSECIAYLKFRLDIPGKPLSAKLRLHVADAGNADSKDAGALRLIENPWQEKDVTYATRPEIGAQVATLGKVEKGGQVEREIPVELLTGDTVSLAIVPTSLDGAGFCSRESASLPALVVTYEAKRQGSPSPPTDQR